MSEPKYVAATLRWCNARRKERGKRPLTRLPKGHQHDPSSCPCGKATGLAVYQGEAVDDSSGLPEYLTVPVSVSQFVRDFDAGRLPQYEATA